MRMHAVLLSVKLAFLVAGVWALGYNSMMSFADFWLLKKTTKVKRKKNAGHGRKCQEHDSKIDNDGAKPIR